MGASGLLWMPLRVLELPLRAAVLRRPGMAVSYKVSGVSHSAMRQLQSLMASTHPQVRARLVYAQVHTTASPVCWLAPIYTYTNWGKTAYWAGKFMPVPYQAGAQSTSLHI